MIARENITGAILAGGASKRMGRNKALLTLGGATFIEHIAVALLEVLPRVMIIADNTDQYRFLQLPLHQDVYKNCGPLGGIHAALVHSATSHTFVISCDTPLVTPAAINSLLTAAQENVITLVSDGERPQPLFAVYPSSACPDMEEAIRSGTRSIFGFIENRAVTVMDFSRYASLLRNVNQPEDYDAILLMKGQRGGNFKS